VDGEKTIGALSLLALYLGFFHTLIGPDHYLPFIVMARARRWSMFKTTWITILCGIGHVGSSVVLGLIGVAAGVALSEVIPIEKFRGSIAAWLLIAFGLVYFVWGVRRAIRNRSHAHVHLHIQNEHNHDHAHHNDHLHVHGGEHPEQKVNITPWVLFTVFVFGPCEPLIPILMYPAATKSWHGLLTVTMLFSAATIGTMLVVVTVGSFGVNFLPIRRIERWTHAMAGAAIALCGVANIVGR
jgi:nickel/cobalt transporter (NicO) family protein